MGEGIWGKIHDKYKDDIAFSLKSEQWSKPEYENRINSTPPRPALVFNKTLPHILKVSNDVKKMKPGVKVRPIGEEDKALSEVRQGLQRSIERDSNGQAVYSQALLNCVAGGIGFWRVANEYQNNKSFDQVLKIKAIPDSCSVMTSDWATPDASDIDFAIISESISKARFKSMTGKEPDDFNGLDTHKAWGSNNALLIHEYWWVENKEDELIELNDGRKIFMSKVPDKDNIESMIAVDDEGKQIRRASSRRVVYWAKVVGAEVVKSMEWKGQWIPLILVKGREVRTDGEITLHSLTGQMRDAQTSYNFTRSAQIERLGLTPKNPYFYPFGSIPKSEEYKYKTSNVKNWWGLGYNPYDAQGRPVPPPTQSQPVALDPSFAQEIAVSSEDIHAVTGIHEPSLGVMEGQTSGAAIKESTLRSDTATYDYPYELGLSIRHSARIINDLIPYVYDTARQITIIGEDDSDKVVWVNRPIEDRNGGYHYNMEQGDYNIEVEMGINQSTKRQETLVGLEKLFKSNPAVGNILGDLYVKEQDWRFSGIASKRVKSFLAKEYPGIVEPETPENMSPEMAQMKQQMELQMQQLNAENQQMDAFIDQQQAKINKMESDNTIKVAELEEKIKTDRQKHHLDMYKAETDAAYKEDKLELEAAKIK